MEGLHKSSASAVVEQVAWCSHTAKDKVDLIALWGQLWTDRHSIR